MVRRRKPPQGPSVAASPYVIEDVIASLGDAIVLTDGAGAILIVNQAAQQLLGLSESQLVRRTVADIMPAAPQLAQMVARALAVGQSQSSGEERLRIGHQVIPVRASCSPIHGRGGSVTGAALVLHDLSYQRKLEDEARRNETLARLGSLVAGLAHEIKNPLGGIRGAAQLLARRIKDDPDARPLTDVVVREVDRLSALVEQLLTFGAPRRPEMKRINVHEVLRDVLEILRPEIAARNIIVRLQIDPSLPEIRADAAQLVQVFLNLIKNSLDVMQPGGKLILETRLEMDFHILRRSGGTSLPGESRRAPSHGQFLRIGVADDGPGFPPDLAQRVFEPFVTTKARGTGLGLAICERIIAAHGGDIRAENRPEGGGLVTVTLPLAGV